MPSSLKSEFLIKPDLFFLNHGSFGAVPRPVFETYQNWQREIERSPVEFMDRRFRDLMASAREELAAYLGCQPDEVVFFSNPTTAINVVARSLDLRPGDEILVNDHEYGAMLRSWGFVAGKTGARIVSAAIPLPVQKHDEIIESIWSQVTPRTRILFISHITSATALIFPIEELCRRAREAGILSVIDGAHAPGQIPLDLSSLGADIYAGTCHKWLCAPRGAGFLFARKGVQDQLFDPLVVSWGYQSETPSDSKFIDHHEWQGTRDISAFLSVPAAIAFQREHNWEKVQARCHALAKETRQRINSLTGMPPISPDTSDWYRQMAAVQLPASGDPLDLKQTLFDEHHIEIPVYRWNDRPSLRVSFQAYNDQADAEALLAALEGSLSPKVRI
jgi:isopenicillin-N epimerase